MDEILSRLCQNLSGRFHGPLAFRFVLQPLTAALMAFRAGVRDARTGRPAFGWAVITNPVGRRDLLLEGWREISSVFVVAVVIDLIYEAIALQRFYPGESLIVASLLALLPYPVIRGSINRIVRRRFRIGGAPNVQLTPELVPQSLRLAHKAGERLRWQDARGIFGKTASAGRRNQKIDGRAA